MLKSKLFFNSSPILVRVTTPSLSTLKICASGPSSPDIIVANRPAGKRVLNAESISFGKDFKDCSNSFIEFPNSSNCRSASMTSFFTTSKLDVDAFLNSSNAFLYLCPVLELEVGKRFKASIV